MPPCGRFFYRKLACHPGRSAAESRDPGATALRRPLGPGSALRAVRDDTVFWS
ncbi:hypothetical protein CA606_20020 [Caulobacter vibrioides]|uniref:Uncharacterized protein n=1 Tax=Caulobacter vibrioides TaxID=155892 RepID=A0A291IDA6_CAUVI|nr:hypothetical protein [Caulobacter vibrioides]ATG88184.2 hypothetical protein CA606_20020 [Caulobacter vibrioides]